MVKGPLWLPANFKVKCFGSRHNVNEIGKHIPPYPRSSSVELEVVFETRLEEPMSRPIPCNVPAFDAIVEFGEKIDKGMTSGLGMRRRKWHNACLTLATAMAKKVSVLDDGKGALGKQRWMDIVNMTRQW